MDWTYNRRKFQYLLFGLQRTRPISPWCACWRLQRRHSVHFQVQLGRFQPLRRPRRTAVVARATILAACGRRTDNFVPTVTPVGDTDLDELSLAVRDPRRRGFSSGAHSSLWTNRQDCINTAAQEASKVLSSHPYALFNLCE